MNRSLKRFLIIGVLLYVGFLAWFFLGVKPNMNAKWSPSDIYNEVGDCSSTTTSAPPAADQVFEAKTAVPMKSITARRRAMRKRRSSMPMAKSALGKRNSALYSFGVTPVGGGLHLVSDAEFRSFGAEGLMYMSMPQYLRRSNNQVTAPVQMVYPYLPILPDQQVSSDDRNTSNGTVTPSPFYPLSR
jgi:hypothetical protein